MKLLTEEHKRVWKSALEGSPNPGGSAKIQGKRMHHRSTLTKQLFDAAPMGISCDHGQVAGISMTRSTLPCNTDRTAPAWTPRRRQSNGGRHGYSYFIGGEREREQKTKKLLVSNYGFIRFCYLAKSLNTLLRAFFWQLSLLLFKIGHKSAVVDLGISARVNGQNAACEHSLIMPN